jgi:hypothetical protein
MHLIGVWIELCPCTRGELCSRPPQAIAHACRRARWSSRHRSPRPRRFSRRSRSHDRRARGSRKHNGEMPPPSEPAESFWRRLIDDRRHGPLPALLVVMTATTGIVDAVSILSLGRVFVANMTGTWSSSGSHWRRERVLARGVALRARRVPARCGRRRDGASPLRAQPSGANAKRRCG